MCAQVYIIKYSKTLTFSFGHTDNLLSFSSQQGCNCKTIGRYLKHWSKNSRDFLDVAPGIRKHSNFLFLHSFWYKHCHVSTDNYQLMLWLTCTCKVSGTPLYTCCLALTILLTNWKDFWNISVPCSKPLHRRTGFNPVIMYLVKTMLPWLQ